MEDGRVIDSTSWNFWEWPQAIGLNGLVDVSASFWHVSGQLLSVGSITS